MKTRLLLFFAFFTMLQARVSATEELWVGQNYQCFASDYYNTRYSQFNISWSVDYGLYTNYSGTHVRTVSFDKYRSGTYNVKVTWTETDMSNDYDTNLYHKSHTWSFTCKDNPLKLSQTSMSLTVGQSQQLSCSFTYNNSYTQGISYSSSDTSVATVSSSGVVTAKGQGTATITVSSASSRDSKTCTVTVTPADIKVTSITLNKTSLSLQPDGEETLTATVKPDNATNKTVTWTSSNESAATVNNGKVKAVATGSATITCTANDGSGVKATCTVTVNKPTGIDINATNFPDANFRNYLLSQSYGQDGVLTDKEIKEVTNISVNGNSISSLKGIEFFTALKELWCYDNQLTSLDVSKNTVLTSLYCYNNHIKGTDMDDLISSLPQNTTNDQHQFRVIDPTCDTEGNVCTKAQVAAVKAKGWFPCCYDYDTKELVEYEGSEEVTIIKGDVNGDGYVNGTDLVALTNIILGKSEEKACADVNGDGNVNGTDYVVLVNIILGKSNARTY